MTDPLPCPRCGSPGRGTACPACGSLPPTDAFHQESFGLLRAGETFHGLEIVEPLGHGGMGEVYKARQPSLNRFVALKILSSRPDVAALGLRFEREAQSLAALSHPNIVPIYDFGKEGDIPYIVMEYVPGTTLRRRRAERKLSHDEIRTIFCQVLDALAYAHAHGIVHRDIKPENILIDAEGRVRVADFGLAKWKTPGTALTTTGARLGTPAYMAPEQFEDAKTIDHRADIYAAGVLLREMSGNDPRWRDVVARATAADPERRTAGAQELKLDFLRAPRSSRRFPLLLTLLLAVLAVAIPWGLKPRRPAERPPSISDSGYVARARLAGEFLPPQWALALAADGRFVAFADRRGAIRLSSLPDFRDLSSPGLHFPPVVSLAISADGRILASGGADGTAAVWSTTEAKLLFRTPPQPNPVTALAVSPDGRFLAVGGRELKIWNAVDGRELAGTQATVLQLAFAPEGNVLASGDDEGLVTLWETTRWTALRTLPGTGDRIEGLSFGPGGRILAVATLNAIRFFGAAEEGAVDGVRRVRTVVFRPDGDLLAWAGDDRKIHLWDVGRKSERQVLVGHAGPVTALGFRRDGRTLVSASSDATIRLWMLEGQ